MRRQPGAARWISPAISGRAAGSRGPLAGERAHDVVEQARADDAAALPDARHLRQVDVPLVLRRSRGDERHALRVGADLRRVEGVARSRASGRDPGRRTARAHRSRPGRCPAATRWSFMLDSTRASMAAAIVGIGTPSSSATLRRPLARALLARLVLDHVDERLFRLGILDTADLRRELDEERVERPLVPLREDLAGVRRRQAEAAAQHVVRLGDELHVAVLDAVVHHLDEVARAVGSDVRHARPRLGLRGDRLEHIGLMRSQASGDAARHERRTEPRALLAARDAHADEVQAGLAQRRPRAVACPRSTSCRRR